MKLISLIILSLFTLSLPAFGISFDEFSELENQLEAEGLEIIQEEATDSNGGDIPVAQVVHVVNVNSQHCGGQNVVGYNQVVNQCQVKYTNAGKPVKMVTVLTKGTKAQAVQFVKVNKVRGRVLFARRVSASFQVNLVPRTVVVCNQTQVFNRFGIFTRLFGVSVVRSVNTCF